MATVMGGVGYGLYFVAKVRWSDILDLQQSSLTVLLALYFTFNRASHNTTASTRQGKCG